MTNYQEGYFKLLTVVRKDAVCLVDSFNWSDAHLCKKKCFFTINYY